MNDCPVLKENWKNAVAISSKKTTPGSTWLFLQYMVLGENMEKVHSTAVAGNVRGKRKISAIADTDLGTHSR